MKDNENPLSDPEVSMKTNSLRTVSDIATSYYLMAMIQADDQFEYRKYATMLRNQVMPKQENKDTYLCAHPEWFDTSPKEISINEQIVDSTTCSMCGFRIIVHWELIEESLLQYSH